MRFQLDPQGEAPARPPPVQAAPPPVAAAPPPPPSPRAGPRKRWLLVAGVAALLVVAGSGVGAYVMKVGPFAYPDRYLVQKGEEPNGVRVGALNGPVRDVLGIDKNPGEMPDDKIDELLRNDASEPRPTQAWAEDLSTSFLGEDVFVFAIKYSSDADAKSAIGSASNGCHHRSFGAGGAVLRDGNVIVVVGATGGDATRLARSVQGALLQKSSGLTTACVF